MNRFRNTLIACLLIVTAYHAAGSAASAAPYTSLDGVAGMDAAFDFRRSDPETAALFLRLIHETWLDKDVNEMVNSPRFVVIVNGAAVQLITGEQPEYAAEDRQYLREIAARIEQMAADGIRFEGCLKAAEIFEVDPGRFVAGINKINNAWISLAGYQAQGYSSLPID